MCEWCTRGNEFDEHGCEVRGGLAVGVRLGQHRKHLERGGREGREVGGEGEGVSRGCMHERRGVSRDRKHLEKGGGDKGRGGGSYQGMLHERRVSSYHGTSKETMEYRGSLVLSIRCASIGTLSTLPNSSRQFLKDDSTSLSGSASSWVSAAPRGASLVDTPPASPGTGRFRETGRVERAPVRVNERDNSEVRKCI